MPDSPSRLSASVPSPKSTIIFRPPADAGLFTGGEFPRVLNPLFLRRELRGPLDSKVQSAHNPPVIVQTSETQTHIAVCPLGQEGGSVFDLLNSLWSDEGQDIAEYAVMLAVILVLVVGAIRLIGSNANNVFSNAASSIQ
jgi:Flp pilus assembly pilin Flp